MFQCFLGYSQEYNWTSQLPIDTNVLSGELGNGLRYFIQKNNEPRDRAVLRLHVQTGSLQEADDQLGVAHFVEHLAFNGTKRFEKNEIIHFIERSGSKFGADLNAYTSFDETVYKLLVQTDSSSTLDTALMILKDWAGALRFDSTEIEAERGVIIAEWRNSLSSRQRVQTQEFNTLFGHSRFGKRFPIGDPLLIDTVRKKRLVDYYKKWYQPSRMTIIAVGNFDEAWMKNEIETRFSSLKNTDTTATKKYLLPEDKRQKFKLITDPEAAFTQWKVVCQLEQKSDSVTIIDQIKSGLIFNLYSKMLNQRLVEIKEQGNHTFTFAYLGFSELPAHYRTFVMSGFTPKEQIIPSIQTIAKESQRAALHGFSESEFKRQKISYKASLEQMFKELDKRSSVAIADYIQQSVGQSGYVTDIAQMPAIYEQCLDHISLDDLKAKGYWKAHAIRTAFITTTDENSSLMPDSLKMFSLLDSVLSSDTPPFIDAFSDAPLVNMPIKKGSSVLIKRDSVLGVNAYRLSNGIQLFIKKTDFKNDQILCNAFSSGGISLYGDEDYYSAKHLLSIQRNSGLGAFNKSQLSKKLTGKQIWLSPYISAYEEGFSGQTNQKDLTTFFQLLHLYFTQVRLDSIALENYKIDQKNIFNNIDIDRRSAFGRMVIDLKYQNHLRSPNTKATEFDKINLQKARQIFNERFEDSNDFTFLFVGNVEEDSLLLLAETYLATLPVKLSEETWRDRGLRLAPYPIDTAIISGQTPKSDVILEWHTSFPYKEKYQRYNYYALRELLNIRLREKLREEMGALYGFNIYFRVFNQPEMQCHSRIKFNAAPEKVDSILFYIHAEIEAISAGQIDEQHIQNIQSSQLKKYEEAIRTNHYWLSVLKRKIEADESLEGLYPDVYQPMVEGLNKDDLAKAAENYLLNAVRHCFVLRPVE